MLAPLVLVACTLLGACKNDVEPTRSAVSSSPRAATPTPPVVIDGSSTVLPISESVLAMYAPHLVGDIEIEGHGTSAGFKNFCRKRTDINGASRPISLPEMKLCKQNSVEFIELPVAFDGVAVVASQKNTFIRSLTVAQLKKLWEPAAEGVILRWRDLDPTLPDERIELAGPGLDSGTFDFFTKAVVGEEHSSRSDYKASEDDEELVEFVAERANALGYFGLAYYTKNEKRLRIVPIDDNNDKNGDGAVEPNAETINDGTYQPLARPLFIYVNRNGAERREVRDFVSFYLRAARLVAPDVGYVGLPTRAFELASKRFAERQTGSVFDGKPIIGLTVEELLSAEIVEVPGNQAHAEGTRTNR